MKTRNSTPFLAVSGLAFIIVGLVFIANSFSSITGLVIISETTPTSSSIIGIWFAAFGATLLSLTRKKSKGQAAVEFLMTYGWAILAAIVTIGVFSYFSVISVSLSPATNFISINSPFSATVGAAYESNSEIWIEISNNDPKNLILSEATISGTSSSGRFTCATLSNAPVPIQSGRTQLIKITGCDNEFETDNLLKGDLTITYTKEDGTAELISTGVLNTNIQSSSPSNLPAESICDDSFDNDYDEQTDCDDSDCDADANCQPEEPEAPQIPGGGGLPIPG